MKISKNTHVYNYLANRIMANTRMIKQLKEDEEWARTILNYSFSIPNKEPLTDDEFKIKKDLEINNNTEMNDHYTRIYFNDDLNQSYKFFKPIELHKMIYQSDDRQPAHPNEEWNSIVKFHKDCFEYYQSL